MNEHSENPASPDGASVGGAAEMPRATVDATPPAADATPTAALPPQTAAAQTAAAQTPAAQAAASGSLPPAPVANGTPSAAPVSPARPFWSRTGTRIGAGIIGAAVVLMIGFGGGWVAHGVLRPFGMHEQAWGPGGGRGLMHDDFGGQRVPQDGQRFGDGQRPGSNDGGTNDGSDDDSNGNAPTPGSTPGS